MCDSAQVLFGCSAFTFEIQTGFLAFLSHQRHKHQYKWNYCSAGVNKHPFEASVVKGLERVNREKWLR